MHPAAQEAAAAIEREITPDTPADLASAIRHAASVATRFSCEKRTHRQLRQHARFHEANEPKSKAYTTAADIFARLTGIPRFSLTPE